MPVHCEEIAHTIQNKNGMVVKITNYGAKVEQILLPDKNGVLGDVAQGYETIDQVVGGQGSMGAFIGRYANRIGKGKFTLEGKDYQLELNNGQNSLHGGKKGSRFVVFDARQLSDSSVEMTYTFKDGEENYPGTVPVRVVYVGTRTFAILYCESMRRKQCLLLIGLVISPYKFIGIIITTSGR